MPLSTKLSQSVHTSAKKAKRHVWQMAGGTSLRLSEDQRLMKKEAQSALGRQVH